MKPRQLLYFYLLTAVLVSRSPQIVAQELAMWNSARQTGTASAAIPGDFAPLHLIQNPSFLLRATGLQVEFGYSHPFGMAELQSKALGMSLPIGRLAFGLALRTFGFSLYRKQAVDAGGAFSPLEGLALGGSISVRRLEIRGYGQATRDAFNLGWHYQITETLSLAGALQNLTRSCWSQEEPLPQTLSMSACMRALPELWILAEILKDSAYPPEGRLALTARMTPHLLVRSGISRNPARFSAGLSLQLSHLSLDYGFSYHAVLGYTHVFGTVLALK